MQLRGKQRICPLRTDADWLLPFGFPVVVGAQLSRRRASLSNTGKRKHFNCPELRALLACS